MLLSQKKREEAEKLVSIITHMKPNERQKLCHKHTVTSVLCELAWREGVPRLAGGTHPADRPGFAREQARGAARAVSARRPTTAR